MKITFPALFLLLITGFVTQAQEPSAGFKLINAKKEAANTPAFKKLGTGPRYWMAYEYCWINNKAIPEHLWKANVDWVAENFKDYGYDMVCTDGWIEAAQTINENGFITKYNSDWENGFEYWARYAENKGMKLGVYYNPLWLTKTAFKENKEVIGANTTTQAITGTIPFNGDLNWVDVAQPGAKEWVQGYIKYFKSIGVNYLRIDFLENYENNYGTDKYETALKWMREAADSTMFLSLVMPNCFDHGVTELKYGDMIRISDDCFDGGWEFLSNRRRGLKKPNWPQYGNTFDGFVKFADLGGRDQLILDGDFIRLNTLKDDKEKKFQISLFTMAGSPITIADQFNTIEKNAWLYQNKELLHLNDAGFVGKPFSYDVNEKDKSSKWAGQLPDGRWIVGLFNREEVNQKRAIDFASDLGLPTGKKYVIRDLWEHKDLGWFAKEVAVNLLPHESRLLEIKNTNKQFEAEFASLLKGAQRNNARESYNGWGYAEMDRKGASILFAVEASSKGEHNFTLKSLSPGRDGAKATVYINGERADALIISSSTKWQHIPLTYSLEKGVNYIEIRYDGDGSNSILIDYISIQ